MLRRAALSATLLAACAWSADRPAATAPAPAPTVVAGERTISIDAPDARLVAKARFFVSRDGGKTWTLGKEVLVDAAKPVLPSFAFKPAGDGLYHVVTATTYRDGRGEPDPAAGSLPPKALALLVDSSAPAVTSFDAVAAVPTAEKPEEFPVTVTWAIAEANLAAATIDRSTDGGSTWVTVQTVPATGSATLSLPVPAKGEVLLRLAAKDAAGNQTATPPKAVTPPKPVDPEQALAAAVSSLPALADVAPGEAAAATAPAAAGEPEAATAAAIAVPPVATAPQSTIRPTAPPEGTTFLAGAEAESTLAEARAKRDGGEPDAALVIYLRLHDSSVAKEAVVEELTMLEALGDAAAVADIANGLRPELRSDAVRLLHAKAELALGHFADADATARTVRRGAEESRAALLVIGQAAAGQGKQALATRIYEKLAAGDDEVATQAKLLRGK